MKISETSSGPELRSPMVYARRSLVVNAFGFLVTLGGQVALLPLFLHTVGSGRYSSWLVVSAITANIALADIGLSWAIGVRLSELQSADRCQEASYIWRTSLAVVLGSGLLIISILSAVVFQPEMQRILGLRFRVGEAGPLVLLLSLHALLCLTTAVGAAAMRSLGRYPQGITAENVARATELLLCAATLFVVKDLRAVAVAYVIVRGIHAIWILRNLHPLYTVGFGGICYSRLKGVRSAAAGNVCLIFGNSLLAQGCLLALNAFCPPIAVVAYSAARTYSGALRQALDIVLGGIQPAFTEALITGDVGSQRRLLRVMVAYSALVSVIFLATALCFGPTLVHLWSGGSLVVSGALLALTVGSAALDVPYLVLITPLMAMNRHLPVALAFVVGAFLSLVASMPLARMFGAQGVAGATALVDLFVTPIAIMAYFRFGRSSRRLALRGAGLSRPGHEISEVDHR